MAKKIYIVSLYSRTVQEKCVEAESKEQAIEIAHNGDWDGKEEMLDSELKARVAKLGGKNREVYPGEYIETENGDYRYKESKTEPAKA